MKHDWHNEVARPPWNNRLVLDALKPSSFQPRMSCELAGTTPTASQERTAQAQKPHLTRLISQRDAQTVGSTFSIIIAINPRSPTGEPLLFMLIRKTR